MCVMPVGSLDELTDDSGLASASPLNHTHSLSDLKMLAHLVSPHLDLERAARPLNAGRSKGNYAIMHARNHTDHVLELTINDSNLVILLNLKLRIITNRLLQRLVVKTIPLVELIFIEVTVLV